MPTEPRWTIEQVVAIAPTPASVTAAEPLATPTRWAAAGCDDTALWGRCRGSGAEPYETAVDHVTVGWRCSCPSRRQPCKHALALLIMWVRDELGAGVRPAGVAAWIDRRRPTTEPAPPSPSPPDATGDPLPPTGDDAPAPPDPIDRDRGRDERIARMLAGMVELDRWLDDRMRTGLADPSLARYATWDDLAARLVDARAGALANRVRRLAGLVGASPDWHAHVLAELGVLHLLAQAATRVPELPGGLADTVATAAGWQVKQADVLAGVPETDDWVVAGRSDTREDRIEVRRVWLRGARSGRWAMVLSFAAYRQSLDTSLEVGTVLPADLLRYPGPALRALVGERHGPALAAEPRAGTIAEACDDIGTAVAGEPWLDRHPATVVAAPARVDGRWVLGDHTGSLPLAGSTETLATLLAASAGDPLTVTIEWTPHGVIPLTVHLPDRAIDVGPRAEPSFVDRA